MKLYSIFNISLLTILLGINLGHASSENIETKSNKENCGPETVERKQKHTNDGHPELDYMTIKDEEIITEQDIRFCGDKLKSGLRYSDIGPEKLPDNGEVTKNLVPGAIHLSDGHAAMIIHDKNRLNQVLLMSSTIPTKVRNFSIDPYETIDVPLDNGTQGSGIVAWQWSVNCGDKKMYLVRDSKMPYYEKDYFQEDYGETLADIDLNDILNVGITREEIENKIENDIQVYLGKVKSLVDGRMTLIKDPEAKKKLKQLKTLIHSCHQEATQKSPLLSKTTPEKHLMRSFKGDVEKYLENYKDFDCYKSLTLTQKNAVKEQIKVYDQYSTPSRDGKMASTLKNLGQFLKTYSQDDQYKEQYERILSNNSIEFNGHQISYGLFLEIFDDWKKSSFIQQGTAFSPIPWEDESKCWGIENIQTQQKKFNELLNAREQLENYYIQRETPVYGRTPTDVVIYQRRTTSAISEIHNRYHISIAPIEQEKKIEKIALELGISQKRIDEELIKRNTIINKGYKKVSNK